MSDVAARHALPFILPGQAQKEMFHNEAVEAVDTLLHPVVEGAPLADPPAAPGPGRCWIVAAGAVGAWAGQDGAIARAGAGGWRFQAPVAGMIAWDQAAGSVLQHDGTDWRAAIATGGIRIGGAQIIGPRRPAIASPSGGATIDVEARAAIAAIIATFMSHGLTD